MGAYLNGKRGDVDSIVNTGSNPAAPTMDYCLRFIRPLGIAYLNCVEPLHPGVAQLVERLLWEQGAGRSNRPTRTTRQQPRQSDFLLGLRAYRPGAG